jgi:hypothetical protein
VKGVSSLMSRLSLVLPLLLVGCTEAEVVADLPSLQGSEDAVFLCRDANGMGRPFADCPDRDGRDDESKDKALSIFALVSQTVTDQVAVVNVTSGRVIDVEPSTPGFGFLRVGGRPVSMAATPGGYATFVGTAELGRNGIFALPTSCIDAPGEDDQVRDLTSWPACRLDSAPGEIAVLVQQQGGDAQLCGAPPAGPSDGAVGGCTADLQSEGGPAGRRKLVVSLPDSGELVVIDAQGLLDQPAGEFPPCQIEARVSLRVDVPADAVQSLPADLLASCSEVPAPTAPPPSQRAPQPAGFAVGDGRLYVADQAAPVIHVLDTSNLCEMIELPPLLPMSLREPDRVVTTRRVAVSPLTPSNKQYVYAIDAEDQPGASVMAFDVSPDSTERTPLVRSGSPELPGEKPDRLGLAASAKDVTFAYRDLPYADPATGVGTFGTFCDPNPELPNDSPAALARPSQDFASGARPGLLRGLFGFVLLSNGTIAVVDVEDFDAPCRRPITANHGSTPDFRGCAGDPEGIDFYTATNASGGDRTVTDEVSCRVVEPHRFRGERLAINDADQGVLAPSLRSYPQLTLPDDGGSVAVEDRPRLLGVPFADSEGRRQDIDVFIGSTPHGTAPDSEQLLPLDPNDNSSEQAQTLNAVVLPPLQPRAYASEDTVTLTYEGSFAGDRGAGFLDADLTLRDATLSFCSAGVYDQAAMAHYAENELSLSGEDVASFGRKHADYVQIISPLLDRSDEYWARSGVSHAACLETFKEHDAEPLADTRDFRILEAFGDRLVLEPRQGDPGGPSAAECFPSANQYRLRAGAHWVLLHAAFGFKHDVVESGAARACTRSCDPLKKWAKGRAFEISSSEPNCRDADPDAEPFELRVGCANGDVACVYDQTVEPDPRLDQFGSGVQLGGPGSECIFDGLTERFALYRGRAPSKRDSTFTWQTSGGYRPLLMSLASVSNNTSPQSLQFLQEPELMAVVDGSGLGLSLFSLDTFTVTKPSPFD